MVKPSRKENISTWIQEKQESSFCSREHRDCYFWKGGTLLITQRKPCCGHSSLSICYPSTSGIVVISTQAPGSDPLGAQLVHSPHTHLSLRSSSQPSSPRVGDWITSPSARASAGASSFLLWTQTQRLRLSLSPILSQLLSLLLLLLPGLFSTSPSPVMVNFLFIFGAARGQWEEPTLLIC